LRKAYSGVRYKTYVEFQNNNSILIGHKEELLGTGNVVGNLITDINPNSIQTYIGRAVNLKLDEFIYESRRISQHIEDKLTGTIVNVVANGNDWDIQMSGGAFLTELALTDYIRINGNLPTYLKVTVITDNDNITVSGDSWVGLSGKSIFLYTGTEMTKDFRDDHTGVEIYIHSYNNNTNGVLQYDDFGNFLTTDRIAIDSCQEFFNIDSGMGLLVHNADKTKTLFVEDTFDSIIDTDYKGLNSKSFLGGYVIGENEPIYYKINSQKVRYNFELTNQLTVSELTTNSIYQVQLNGTALLKGRDYTLNLSSNTITFLGNFLSNFNNVAVIIIYSKNQDIVAQGCQIRLTLKGYDENQIKHDYEKYLDELASCMTFIDPSPNPNHTNKVIETLDKKIDREITVSANNRLTFRQSSLYDNAINNTIEEPLYGYVTGRGIYFRLVRVGDEHERLEYYNDCIFDDPIQKSTTAISEEYDISLHYKDRKEYQLQLAGDNIAIKNSTYLLISEN